MRVLAIIVALLLSGCTALVPDMPVHPWGCSDWCTDNRAAA